MKKIHITVSEKILDELKAEKDDTGAPVTEIVRRAIAEYLERRKEVKRKLSETVEK